MNKQLLAFNVMSAVQSSYVAEGLPDGEFARKISAVLKTEVSTARVRQARMTLSIPSNAPENKSDRDLAQAKGLLESVLRDVPVDLSVHLAQKIRDFLGIGQKVPQ